MNFSNDPLAPVAFESAVSLCPWAIAVIDDNGKVRSVNPAFENITGIDATSVLGMREAAFAAMLSALLLEVSRVEAQQAGLRALFYLRKSTVNPEHNPELVLLKQSLRAPLASIYGFAELLMTQNYDDNTRFDLIGTLLEQTELMINIINQK